MPLADWEFFGTPQVEVTAAQKLKMTLATLQRANGVPLASLPHGFLSGVCRGTFTPAEMTNFDSQVHYFGLCCMQSARNLTLSTSKAYALLFGATGSSPLTFVTELQLLRLGAGLPTAQYSLDPTQSASGEGQELARVGGLHYGVGTTLALELEWRLDLAELGGVELIGRFGVAGYPAMATVMHVIDMKSALSTTVGEGFAARGAGSTALQLSIDDSETDELV